ncbi:unnamed protein product [Urochloa humidicola]
MPRMLRLAAVLTAKPCRTFLSFPPSQQQTQAARNAAAPNHTASFTAHARCELEPHRNRPVLAPLRSTRVALTQPACSPDRVVAAHSAAPAQTRADDVACPGPDAEDRQPSVPSCSCEP